MKKIRMIKLGFAAVFLSASSLFFINSTAINAGSNCKHCGSIDACYNGDSTTQKGYEFCDIVPGTPPCEVSGYGKCTAVAE
jgi:hypothetical protein